MNLPSRPARAHPAEPAACDEEYCLQGAEALVAGTLALMTGHAQACSPDMRATMACKVTANLHALSHGNACTPEFRAMLWNLQARWAQLCAAADAPAASAHQAAAQQRPSAQQRYALWMAAPEVLQ